MTNSTIDESLARRLAAFAQTPSPEIPRVDDVEELAIKRDRRGQHAMKPVATSFKRRMKR